ncbi:MAG: hypothetical protein J6Q60_01030 [Bacteroidaceae bacterium]|nr:hypothetical protein [Bacteroidaceae bacterium]
MENWGYSVIGEALIIMGKALKDPNSDIRKDFVLSREQLQTLIGVVKLSASPGVQKKYIWDLAKRWNVTQRTVENWIKVGVVRPGRKSVHDTRLWWSDADLDEDERKLIKLGYIKKPNKFRRKLYFWRMLSNWINEQ